MSAPHTVEANGITLAYRVWGDRTAAVPVLLLHCLGADSADWDGVAPELALSRRVYGLDLRGHGGSDRPGAYAVELMRDDVAAFLDALGLTRAVVVGHSLGGVVAYLFAQRYPARVERLVIEDSPLLVPQDPPLPPPERPAEPPAFDWEVKVQFTAERSTPDPAWTEELAAITAPTLVIAGGAASHLPQKLMTALAERIPDARLVTIEAGHLVHEARPGEFLAAVRAFLDPLENADADVADDPDASASDADTDASDADPARGA